MQDVFDLIVIGAGSGGVRASRWASQLGAKVAIIEERFLGGTCVNVGCVPKKMFAYAAELNQQAELASSYGIALTSEFEWTQLRDNKTKEIQRLNGIYEKILKNAGVTLIEGHGKITATGDLQQVSVGDTVYHAKKVLVATGGTPFRPELPGAELAAISDDLFYLPTLPKRAVVVGGGYIACEFASILNGLGVEVTQLYRRDLFLRGFDSDIRQFVAKQMAASGIDLRFNTDVASIEENGVQLAGGEFLPTDKVFFATGRTANLNGLFAPDCAPELTSNGLIAVADNFETNIAGVYALGDVVGRLALTPVALAEGMWLAEELFGTKNTRPMSYDDIATAVFCNPNIATIGLSQEQALQQFGKLRVYKSEFRPLRYSLGEVQQRSLMKLVVDDASDRVVGIHMAGDDAAEIMQGLAVAVNMGATKADLDRTIGIHPTSAEEFVTMRQAEVVES